jgi:hypothetical protein
VVIHRDLVASTGGPWYLVVILHDGGLFAVHLARWRTQ